MIKKAFAHLSENGGDENVSKMFWIAITFVAGAILLSLVTGAFNGPVANWHNGVIHGWFNDNTGSAVQHSGSAMITQGESASIATAPRESATVQPLWLLLDGSWPSDPKGTGASVRINGSLASNMTKLNKGDVLTLQLMGFRHVYLHWGLGSETLATRCDEYGSAVSVAHNCTCAISDYPDGYFPYSWTVGVTAFRNHIVELTITFV